MEKNINDQINERIKKAIVAVINQQIVERDPPETLETVERLMDEGFSRDEVYTLIGHLISMEMAEELVGERGIDMRRFILALEKLPAPFVSPKKETLEDEE